MESQLPPAVEQTEIKFQNEGVERQRQQPVSIEERNNRIVEQQVQMNGGSEPIIDEASLQQRVQSGEELPFESQMQGDMHNRIRRLIQKTESLHADEQFLKQELKVRQRQTLATFQELMQKKKQLLQLVMQTYNSKTTLVDIGLSEQLDELRKIIDGQQSKILNLRNQISKQGLAGVLTDDKQVRIKTKTEQVQKEYKVGRKFSSTQYVRDYLQRPQAYKVSYQESKYEYELRVRIKESLQQEKKLYEKRKQEINQAKKRQREREQELHKEKDLRSR